MPEMKRLTPDAPPRLAKSESLRELDPRIFDRSFSVAERQGFLAAVRRQQRGVPE